MHGEGDRQSGSLLILFVVSLLALSALPAPASSQTAMFPTGPGVDWFLPLEHGMFLNGTENNAGLDRIHPPNTGQPGGDRSFFGSSVQQPVVSATSDVATQPTNLKGNLTVQLFAGLETVDTSSCFEILPGFPIVEMDTTFYATVSIGTRVVMDNQMSQSMALTGDWNQPHEFTISTEIDEMLDVGETITLDVDVVHNCEARAGHLFWGTYDLTSGLRIDADMLVPSMNATVDQNGVTRIEFTPHSPFGSGDYDNVIIDLIGPLEGWDQGVHYSIMPEEEIRVEHLELPAHGSRQTETGSIAWTWVTNKTLESGMYVIDVCVQTSDGLFDAGLFDSNNPPCHIVGVLRFEVEDTQDAWVTSGWFATIPVLSTLGLIGWMFNSRMPPWPALVVIGLLMLSVLGSIAVLPDIGPEERQHETAAPNFTLLKYGEGKESLSSLLDGKDALVLGVFLAGSPAADLQMEDFISARDKTGESVAYAQIITGDTVEMYDGDSHATKLNGTWPLLIDESDGGVAKQLPTGIADGVIIIDSAGFVVDWKPASISPINIEKSIEKADSGGGRTPFEMMSFASLLVLLPLLILGLPRERIEAPEEVLIPAAGWIGTAGAAATGYFIWALPMSLAAGFGGAMIWTWINLALIAWLIWQSVAMIIWQRVPEIDFIAKQIHSTLPEAYKNWRTEDMFTWDMRLGHWLAWLSWIAMPTLLAQGVGSRISSGGLGFLLAILFLFLFTLIAGLLTLMFRLVASWGGPVSRLGGAISRPIIVRSWGVMTASIALWMVIWMLTGPLFA